MKTFTITCCFILYAFFCGTQTAATTQQMGPVGVVVAFAGAADETTIGDHWLPADGRSLRIIDYPRLFASIGWTYGVGSDHQNATTFQLPDYRGMFLRGLTTNIDQDPDLAARLDPANRKVPAGPIVGSFQSFATAPAVSRPLKALEAGRHDHTVLAEKDATRDPRLDGKCCRETMTSRQENMGVRTSFDGVHFHTIGEGDKETRPVNVAVVWLIRVR